MVKIVYWQATDVDLIVRWPKTTGSREMFTGTYRADFLIRKSELYSVHLCTSDPDQRQIVRVLYLKPEDVIVYSCDRERWETNEVLSTLARNTLPAGSMILAVYIRREDEVLDFADVLRTRYANTLSPDVGDYLLNAVNRIEMALGARGVFLDGFA